MSNLPVNQSPAEVIDISPEALEIANCYLVTQDINKVAEQLDVPAEMVSSILAKREVKSYINSVFFNLGFNNRFKMRRAMDALLQKKFQEMEESDTGSAKDIAELLALSHKMTMEIMQAEIDLEKLRESNIKNQTNIQINDGGNNKYESLIQRLLSGQS